jgi:hypothetical protein
LDMLHKEFEFEKEMAAKASIATEEAWKKRWESLPEHQAERLIEESNLISLRESKVKGMKHFEALPPLPLCCVRMHSFS